MMLLSLALALSCPKPVMQNVTKFPWNSYDYSSLHTATRRCGELYPKSPCVKLFRKWAKKDYSVVCGRVKEI